MKRHLLLVGLPGSGKSSVARELAERLEAQCSDVDALIEAETGITIPEIFATRGESGFRQLESEIMNRLLWEDPHVIAPGGGWASAVPDLKALADRSLVVYLRVSPDVAAARLEGAVLRPLLQGERLSRMQRLLLERAPRYRTAEAEVDTDGKDVAAVAAELLDLARISAGW